MEPAVDQGAGNLARGMEGGRPSVGLGRQRGLDARRQGPAPRVRSALGAACPAHRTRRTRTLADGRPGHAEAARLLRPGAPAGSRPRGGAARRGTRFLVPRRSDDHRRPARRQARADHPPAHRPGGSALPPARVPRERLARAGDGGGRKEPARRAGLRLRTRTLRLHARRHVMEVDRAKVRMYKKLLGDCFLISVEGSDRNQPASAHILVDCGVLQGTRGSKDLMVAAVEDIYATAGDKGLDLVVVTHEHYDHICGFKLADHLFEERGFDNLWMAWTDDPDDPDGKQLQEQFGQAYAALAGMAARFGVRTAFDDFENEALLGLAGFSGPLAVPLDEGGEGEEALTSAQDGLAAAKRARTVRGSRKIYLALKEWAGST